IDEAAVDPCNDNGTGTDPSDDTFEVTVNATAINPGASNQFTVTDGTTTWGPFDYGVGGMVTDLPANSTNITLTFTDLDDLVCSSAIEVSQNPCSECNLQIDAGPEQFINCSTLSTQLFGTSNEAAFFEWTGPGINVSNQNQEQPMVDLPGLYTLTVINLSTGCIETDEVLVELMDDVPVAVASTPEIITCKTTSLELNSNGSSSGSTIVYTWSGPDPNLNVNASNPVITIPGNYILLVTDTTNNCSAVDTVAVGINVDPPVATINLTGSLSCNTTSAVIDGLDSSVGDSIQYQWYFGGQMIPGADQISTTINQAGEYTFVVLNIINGCDAADSLIVVDDMTYPIASAGEAELLTCATDSVQLNGSGSTNATQITYEWTGPPGGILFGGNTIMPWVTLPGTYIISVVDTLNGCENLDTVIVSQDILIPISDAGSDVILDCNSLEAGLDGSNSSTGSLYTFQWLGNNGSIVSGGSTLQPTVGATGDYSLVITNVENGCTAIDNVLVTFPDVPTDLTFSVINPSCFGYNDGSITIDSVIGGYPPYSFELDNQEQTDNNTFSPLTAGNYSLNVTDSHGCGFETTMQLQDGNNVYLKLEEDATIQLGESIILHSYMNLAPSEVESLQWTPIDGTLNCYDCTDPIAAPMETTTYTAQIWDYDGCTSSDDITIFLLKDRKVYIPNVFSPNGDGINDIFLIYARQGVKQINSLQIFSRWGEKVFANYNFQPNDPDHGWDGIFRDEKMNPAVFVFWAEIEFLDGFKKLYKGDVTLVK
ncbi:MAG: T9SS type B sorting domain-containing protein, partial [Bacteroidetes bacterium]|nr:T9SS type B sorting domain-containing protein [Bacteroidota bacterium]